MDKQNNRRQNNRRQNNRRQNKKKTGHGKHKHTIEDRTSCDTLFNSSTVAVVNFEASDSLSLTLADNLLKLSFILMNKMVARVIANLDSNEFLQQYK